LIADCIILLWYHNCVISLLAYATILVAGATFAAAAATHSVSAYLPKKVYKREMTRKETAITETATQLPPRNARTVGRQVDLIPQLTRNLSPRQ
jgi:hypothetical protein